MSAGLVVTLAALLWPALPTGPSDPAGRLRLSLACDLWAAAWLAVCVALTFYPTMRLIIGRAGWRRGVTYAAWG